MKTFKTILFLMILSTVCTIFLASGNYAFMKFSAIFNVRLYGTILEMFEMDISEDQVEEVFLKNFDIQTVGDTTYYITKGDLEPGIVVFKHDGPGLWSNIEILLAVKPNRKNLYKMRVISQAETPGLGARIVEKEFLSQFDDVEIRPEVKLVKFSSKPNEVDAISGATNTSNLLQIIINKGIEKMDLVIKEEE
ncbi:MAG: FMN-binding protein [Spirochaetaceae bacterium]|nr:FMN-binding protein [Spirochaetaceae bacterium]